MLSAIDLFLLEGVVALIRICLCILSAIKGTTLNRFSYIFLDDLRDLDFEETLIYMKTFVLP